MLDIYLDWSLIFPQKLYPATLAAKPLVVIEPVPDIMIAVDAVLICHLECWLASQPAWATFS